MPSFRISPFRTSDLSVNVGLPESRVAAEMLDKRFGEKGWTLVPHGKAAIRFALEALSLGENDCVTILTTSGNHYISGCVTREIERICRWSRNFETNSKALFVNHEFGFPFRDLESLREHNLPIIEDACHSFLADTPTGKLGHVGDFVVFSLPKAFPIQFGGLLVHDKKYAPPDPSGLDTSATQFLLNALSYYWPALESARAARRNNHLELLRRLKPFGVEARFDLLELDVPGAFLFTVPAGTDLQAMKEHGWRHGIECSVFYGENAFFIPVNERLTSVDLDYFAAVFSPFLRLSGHDDHS